MKALANAKMTLLKWKILQIKLDIFQKLPKNNITDKVISPKVIKNACDHDFSMKIVIIV